MDRRWNLILANRAMDVGPPPDPTDIALLIRIEHQDAELLPADAETAAFFRR